MKDGSHVARPAPLLDNESTITERRISSSSRELLEAQEKMKELELELERAQIVEAEERYSSQLTDLQEALQAQEAKQKEVTEVKEAFDSLNIEIENSRKRKQELEQDLQSSAEEARKFEELHKQSGLHAESEHKRALEFERLLETAKLSAKMEDQLASLQEEVKGLHEKVAENQKVNAALQSTTAELSVAQEDLALSKSLVLDLEQRLASKEDFINLENIFAATKEDLQAKVSELEDTKLKVDEEIKQGNWSKKAEGQRNSDRRCAGSVNSKHVFIAEQRNVELEQQLNLIELKGLKLRRTEGILRKYLNLLPIGRELTEELKIAAERSTQHEDRANMSHQRSLELEDLFQTSHSKLEGAETKEKELTDCLNLATEIESIENDLKASGLRESEATEKLKAAEEQLEQHVAQASGQSATLRRIGSEFKKLPRWKAQMTTTKEMLEVENKVLQSSSENELLLQTNIQLKAELTSFRNCLIRLFLRRKKFEVEETLAKLKQLESFVEELQTKSSHFENENGGLAGANLKLTQELATYESKLRQRFQSQISSLMEENNLLNKTHQDTKKELQSVIVQLEEQLKKEKENENENSLILEIRNLKDEIAEKSRMQTRDKELEEQLVKLETQLKEENTMPDPGDRDSINAQVLQFQRDLQLALRTINQQEEQEKLEEVAKQTPSSSSSSITHTEAASPLSTVKFIVGVALVSVIIGVILGKRY
ncbi:putative HAT transposon superfamily [Hibiscus syriacus]|uniref:HAT transposon superfamily n=1 Tax=Hibiscus syriacus TaxID=106335 RepID=A0A6A2XLZ4_HIBSY|nr:putative HAT transposon superfamily [Hibiscus syriacus]